MSEEQDFDSIIAENPERNNFVEIASDALSGVQYKLFFLMFAIFMFLSSDTFINRLLSRIDGAVDYKTPTSYGTGLQGIFLIIACISIDMLINVHVL